MQGKPLTPAPFVVEHRRVRVAIDDAAHWGRLDGDDVVLDSGERIPEAGGLPPPDRTYGRGLLLLRVSAGEVPSAGVQRMLDHERPLTISPDERRQLIRRSVLLAVGLTALFVVLLWLAGWL